MTPPPLKSAPKDRPKKDRSGQDKSGQHREATESPSTPAFTEATPPTVLVTGGALRIGRAICLSLAERGWHVGVHYHRSSQPAADVVATITAAGGKAVALRSDLQDEAAYASLVDQACQALGPLGCLINNASTFEYDHITTATRASWDKHMNVNLRAPFALSQHMAAQLPKTANGIIINMIDQRVWNPTPFFATYTLSKCGLWSMTQTLALALAPRIRVNAIGPGPVLPSQYQTPEQFQQQCQAMPLQRGASLADVCRAIGYLLATPSITGQMIALDGGQHLGWAHRASMPGEDDPDTT